MSHSGDRAGAPMVLLRFLDWLASETGVDVEVMLLHGGDMEREFKRFDAKVVGGGGSRLWMLQQGLKKMGYHKAASLLAAARLGPVTWPKRKAPLILMNSVGSLPALRFMPTVAGTARVLYVHELDESLERTVGLGTWDQLSPRVDHFIACSEAVREMLVERKGVDPERVSVHQGFVDEQRVEPSRSDHLRHSLGIPPSALVVGGSGRMEWRKAPEVFLRVASEIVSRRPDLDPHFVWLGGSLDDSMGWRLMHDVDAAGLSGRVHLPGLTRNPGEFMSMFDVFALTSRLDPFPLTMLESSDLGVPVVAFANGGVVEFAAAGGEDAPLAEIVPYLDVQAMASSILRLADEPTEGAAMAERAARHVRTEHITAPAAARLFETLTDVQPLLGPGLHVRRPTEGARSMADD